MSHLFKLKKNEKTVGYLRIAQVPNLGMRVEFQRVTDEKTSWYVGDGLVFDTAHPFVTKDKNGKDVFEGDEVLVYRGKKNIGEGFVAFNGRFFWWVVNNSNQDTDREPPQDWSQLTLCDVSIELLEEQPNE